MRPDDTAPFGAVLIPLRRRDGSTRAFAIVDVADAEWVSQWKWHLHTAGRGRADEDGYVRRNRVAGELRAFYWLHHELLGISGERGETDVDHINRNGLDNRRSNLRVIPSAGNSQNRRPRIGAKSTYRGVQWDPRGNGKNWRAVVTVDGRKKHLGRFLTEEEAAETARATRAQHLPYATD